MLLPSGAGGEALGEGGGGLPLGTGRRASVRSRGRQLWAGHQTPPVGALRPSPRLCPWRPPCLGISCQAGHAGERAPPGGLAVSPALGLLPPPAPQDPPPPPQQTPPWTLPNQALDGPPPPLRAAEDPRGRQHQSSHSAPHRSCFLSPKAWLKPSSPWAPAPFSAPQPGPVSPARSAVDTGAGRTVQPEGGQQGLSSGRVVCSEEPRAGTWPPPQRPLAGSFIPRSLCHSQVTSAHPPAAGGATPRPPRSQRA